MAKVKLCRKVKVEGSYLINLKLHSSHQILKLQVADKSLSSSYAVHPPRFRPALPAPEHPTIGPARGIRRHCGPAGHECVVKTAAGLRGGICSGVLPAGSTRGRGASRVHALWSRAGQRAWWRHLQGAALSALLLLLMFAVVAELPSLRGHFLFHLRNTCVDFYRASCQYYTWFILLSKQHLGGIVYCCSHVAQHSIIHLRQLQVLVKMLFFFIHWCMFSQYWWPLRTHYRWGL